MRRVVVGSVPTDPFVPSDPSARPRQQQNLPPGVALPPADDWRSDRPGDLGPDQPEGALFGRPGPNVGYAYTLAQRAKDRLRLGPFEHADDAVAVIAEVAGKRAAQFGRAPVIGDIDLAIALLGYDGSGERGVRRRRGPRSCTRRATSTGAGARSSTRCPTRCCASARPARPRSTRGARRCRALAASG